MSERTKISVVVCTRDRHDTVGQALESILDCAYSPFDLHVMDQSVADDTRGIVESMAASPVASGRLFYHHLDRAGLSRAYNAGFAATGGAIVAMTDDDVVVPADWLSRIAEAFAGDAGAGLLYGQVLIPESLNDAHTRGLIVPALPIPRRERLCRGQGFRVFGMGANMALRRALLDDVWGFDEALGGGGPLRSSQDFDLAYRAYRAGWAILLAPEVRVDHYGTRTLEQWPGTMRNYGIGDGAFYSKHVRCGDGFALWLLLRQLARAAGREARSLLRRGRLEPDLYGRSVLVGIGEARRFAIDRRYRLYRETASGRMEVTQANAVTGARRGTSGGGG
ncbi:MAG: glycosyltransferase family 2 protein [Chthonomonadales bacterium]|nr:glycosyltransferase family 2 protein [Chthonomonadales bacterium]